MNTQRTDVVSVTTGLPGRRKQLLALMKVYEQADPYYRAALMPVIRAAVARLEGRS